MQEALVSELRSRRPRILDNWEALLRAEPVSTPLGHPDALIHLINWTLDQIFTGLADPIARTSQESSAPGADTAPPVCPCGRNPLLAYFAAGEQAMHEALVLSQAALAPIDPTARDSAFTELNLILDQIARREIEAFCGVCQFRPADEHRSTGALVLRLPQEPVKT